MNRRSFLTAAGAAGVLTIASPSAQAASAGGRGRRWIELRKFTFEQDGQRRAFDRFLREGAIPALNRLRVRPVGVFEDRKSPLALYALMQHPNAESALNGIHRLLRDPQFVGKGSGLVDGTKSAAPYKEAESSLFLAFKGAPQIETPVRSPGRIFQLRIYESPSVVTGQKKIEMFNDAGELKIFREVGLAPVFFGEAMVGSKLPNLTYMLGFESAEQQKAAWTKFGQHPEWQRLRAMPEYADNKILRAITNIELTPTDYSQV